MVTKANQKRTFWNQLFKIILIVVSSLATSQLATTNSNVDLAVKTAIVSTTNILLDALSSSSKDSAIILTDKDSTVSSNLQNK